jgi:hypothetical protein
MPPMSRHQRHIRRHRRCGPIFAPIPLPPLPTIIFVPPSLLAPPPFRNAGERALEGVPAAVVTVFGHAVKDDSNGHLPLAFFMHDVTKDSVAIWG